MTHSIRPSDTLMPESMTPPALNSSLSRRSVLSAVAGGALCSMGLAGAAGAEPQAGETAKAPSDKTAFRYSLNTSTIRGQNVGIVKEIEIAAAAGYNAIEPWMGTLDEYVKGGGSLSDLGKRILDAGLTVESAIGFAQWIVDDPMARKAGLEQARRDMDTLAKIGGKRIAAPPVGAHDKPGPDLKTTAQRYHALLELGREIGVVPQLEVWGFSQTLSRLAETVYVAVDTGHPQACMLLDVYHLHKGGSDFASLTLLNGAAMHVFHMNDYPATPGRAEIKDEHRVHAGDGVAPLSTILRTLHATGFRGFLSLELFNRDYWKMDPLEVAKTGLQKMRAAVEKSAGA